MMDRKKAADLAYAEVIDLRRKLAEREKQVVELRDALLNFINYPAEEADYPPPYKKANVALDATKDLSGMVLCEAKPVAWMREHIGVTNSVDTEIERATFTIPLFKARKA